MPTTPFSDEHEALRDSVRRLVDGPLAAAAEEAEGGGTPHAEAVRRCEELGLLDLDDVLAEVVVAEELGRLASGGLTAVLLDAMLAGELTAVAREMSLAVEGGLARGTLPFVPAALVAGTCLVADDEIVFSLEQAEVTPAPSHAWRGAAGATVVVEGVPCTAGGLPTESHWRAELLEAAAAVAGAWSTWRAASAYAQERTAFGRPIARFQVNRHALADSATKLTAAEALVHDVAHAWTRHGPVDPAAARLFATRVANETADLAVQLHGGYGYTMEFDAQRAWRDAHALRNGDARRRRRLEGQVPA